jgi:hypothetical protein
MNGGVNNSCKALCFMGNHLYVGGKFTTAGTVPLTVNYIAKWDGTNWSALGQGLNGSCYAIETDGTNIYVGGKFTMAGTTPCNNIAKWDGTNWTALGSGLNDECHALKVFNFNLYAGGRFTGAGNNSTPLIAKWNLTTPGWSGLSTGLVIKNNVYCICRTITWRYDYITRIGYIYAGGTFANWAWNDGTPRGSKLINVAAWNETNSTWLTEDYDSFVYSTDTGSCYSLCSYKEFLYAGCDIKTSIYNVNYIQSRSLTVPGKGDWTGIGTPDPDLTMFKGFDNTCYTLTVFKKKLVAGGLFMNTSEQNFDCLVKLS